MDTSQNTVKLSSLLVTESLETQERVINLGKKILESLNLPNPDEITQWMVNYIAEQISNSNNSDKVIREKARKNCFETILKLWEYRTHLPTGARPFEKFEGIFKALASLDPDNLENRYFLLTEEDSPNLSENVKPWVELGKNLDIIARILISFSFEQAIEAAQDESSNEWLKLIKDTIKSKEEKVIRIIKNETDISDEEKTDVKSDKIKELTKRIEQLKAFEDISSKLKNTIKSQIETLQKEKGNQ